jgi:hypothetical protein
MITGNPFLTKNYTSGAAISARRIVKWDSSDSTVIQAAAATDLAIGVADLGCTASGDRLDIIHAGIVPVEFGGTVTRGQAVTADGTGKAVAAAPSAGTNNRIIGFAMASAVSGDVALVLIAPGLMQG